MRRVVVIDDDDKPAFSTDTIEVEIATDDELAIIVYENGKPVVYYETVDPSYEASFLPGETLDERNERLLRDSAELRQRDRPSGLSDEPAWTALPAQVVNPYVVEELGLSERSERRHAIGSSFRSGGKAPAIGRPLSGFTPETVRPLAEDLARQAGFDFAQLVAVKPAGKPRADQVPLLDGLAAVVRGLRAAGVPLAIIGDVIDRSKASVSALERRAA